MCPAHCKPQHKTLTAKHSVSYGKYRSLKLGNRNSLAWNLPTQKWRNWQRTRVLVERTKNMRRKKVQGLGREEGRR
jgi:hypothetical protein